jgi:hypothetical protein
MKLIFNTCVAFIIILSSCVKNNTPDIILDDMPDTTAQIRYRGNFSNGPYGTVSGEAQVLKTGTRYDLKLANFSSSNGPDLRVYLSKEMLPVNYKDLGALRATGGNQVYAIADSSNLAQYRYALIHCRQYNHLFGWALLQ